MKKIILLLILTLFAFSENIERYLVDAYINSSGKVQVTEDILYNFANISRHGIYRDIPKNNTYIKNIYVEQNSKKAQIEITNNKNYIRIRIGNPNTYVHGLVNYKISYKIDGFIVRNSGNINQIILDLIGTGWQVPIKYLNLNLHLPQNLVGQTKIEVFKGIFGSTNRLNFKQNGNIINIKIKNLYPHECITVSLSFDKSLIKANKKPTGDYYKNPLYYLFLAPILGLFYFIGKKYNLLENTGSISPKYYPPKNLTVLEAGVIKDNFVDFKELKPAIIELANLGYIKFKEMEKNDIYLEKQEKDPTPLSSDQKLLLNGIFSNVLLVNTKFLKIDSDIFNAIKDTLHNNLVKKGYYTTSVRKARDSFVLMAAVAGILSLGGLLWYIFKDTGLENIFPVAIVSVFIGIGFLMLVSNSKNGDFSGSLFAIGWIVMSSFFLYSVVYSKGVFISIVFAILLIFIGILIIYKKLNTLSFKGLNAKRYLLGLKEFIKRAEQDKIKFFLQEDKQFLNKLLPYAMLFELNNHWLNLYQELNAPLPDWYVGDIGNFSMIDFDNDNFANMSMPSNPSIDSNDFGSFGDFSGGGIGGGGGGSW